MFQGGGALGAYQAGVYQALAEAGCEPTWLSGVSIGAHQCRDHRRQSSRAAAPQRLSSSGRRSAGRKMPATYTPEGDILPRHPQPAHNIVVDERMTMGQPGFFKPRFPTPWT